MQQPSPLSYQTSGDGAPSPPPPPPAATAVGELVVEKAVVVFGRRGCCICRVVELLLVGLGVNPMIAAVDDGDVAEVSGELGKIAGEVVEFPVVFVGGKWFGGLERLVAMHITGELVPMLKDAKALWL